MSLSYSSGFGLSPLVYSRRFTVLMQLVRDGMAQRDAAYRKLQAQVTRAFVTDTSIFDTALEDLSDAEIPIEEGVPDEYEERNQD